MIDWIREHVASPAWAEHCERKPLPRAYSAAGQCRVDADYWADLMRADGIPGGAELVVPPGLEHADRVFSVVVDERPDDVFAHLGPGQFQLFGGRG